MHLFSGFFVIISEDCVRISIVSKSIEFRCAEHVKLCQFFLPFLFSFAQNDDHNTCTTKKKATLVMLPLANWTTYLWHMSTKCANKFIILTFSCRLRCDLFTYVVCLFFLKIIFHPTYAINFLHSAASMVIEGGLLQLHQFTYFKSGIWIL